MPWYSIRHVLQFETRKTGPNVFEERVVCFQAASWAEAHAKAEKEAAEYATGLKTTYHPTQIGYELDDEDATRRDGAEVWSELYDFAGSLEDFYQSRYARYPHNPDL